MVRETRLSPDMFIYPLFACDGRGVRREVASMPGVYQMSVDEIVKEAAAAKAEGISGVLLFGLPSHKDAVGSGAYDADAPVQTAVRALKRDVLGRNVARCLSALDAHPDQLILAGGGALDEEVVAAIGAALGAPSGLPGALLHDPRARFSMIADGVHVHPAVVATAWRAGRRAATEAGPG